MNASTKYEKQLTLFDLAATQIDHRASIDVKRKESNVEKLLTMCFLGPFNVSAELISE
jgi:hypothetical protein